MYNFHQSIQNVTEVRPTRYYPDNSNSVQFEIEVEGGETMTQTLFFGHGEAAAQKAKAFYFGIGGTGENIKHD